MKARRSEIPMRNFALEKVYPFIVEYSGKHNGLTPKLREIGDHFNFTKQQAHNYVKILIQEDLVRVRPQKSRGIVLIGQVYNKLIKKAKSHV